jgi:hypothetical protein
MGSAKKLIQAVYDGNLYVSSTWEMSSENIIRDSVPHQKFSHSIVLNSLENGILYERIENIY